MSVLLRTFGIKQNGEKAYKEFACSIPLKYICGMTEDLDSMQLKLVSDVIDGMETNLSRKNPLFSKSFEKFDDSAFTLRSPSCFKIPSPQLPLTRLGGILQ